MGKMLRIKILVLSLTMKNGYLKLLFLQPTFVYFKYLFQFDDLSNQGSSRSLDRFNFEHIDTEVPTSFGNEAPICGEVKGKVRSRSGKVAHGIKTFVETEKSISKSQERKSPKNNGKDAKNENERVHKNSMEEWEARLCVQKEKISAVDRLVEKNAGEQQERVSTAECNITGPKNKGIN